MQARSYQTECVQSLWSYFSAGNLGNPVCALPTGTGKSVCIALFLQSVYQQFPGQKVLVLTHVKELIEQNYKKLLELWPTAPAGVYSAGLKRRDIMQRIIFAGIASIAKRAHEFGHVDLVIVDECHLVSPADATMYKMVFALLKTVNPHLRVIGFTATPWRLGYGKITEGEDALFNDICFDITNVWAFNRLIAEGFLAPVVPKATRTKLELDGVHMRGGEYIPSELQTAVDKEHITRAALNEAMNWRETRHSWLIFASGVEHAIHIDEMLQEFGMTGGVVHGKMTTEERDANIAAFKSGKFQYIVNNNILTTGFDHPCVDLILCLRPTASAVLWVQMLGRGTRPYNPMYPGNVDPIAFPFAKTNCMVLDFAGNSKRLGPINDPNVPRKKGEKAGPAPIKECPVCKCDVHASLRWCNGEMDDGSKCTHEFTFETKLHLEASSTELIKGDLPIVENFRIDQVTYSVHNKMGKPPSVKVSYFCGKRMFNEFVCLEHGGNVTHKAQKWVRDRLNAGLTKTADLLAVATELATPTHLKVWTNQKYPTILNHCFDNTNFGTEEPGEFMPPAAEVVTGHANIRLGTQIASVENSMVDPDGDNYGF